MITVISAWYNEEFLANIFLQHYSFADKIIILLDEGTTDKSREIIESFPNTKITTLYMPDGMDDQLKIDQINIAYQTIDTGWVISVDADEFIHDPDSAKGLLSKTSSDIIKVSFYQMYQNIEEHALNREDPVFEQRRHGDPNISSGINSLYCKPCIAKAQRPIYWTPGCHSVVGLYSVSNMWLRGAHWAMADPMLAIKRRIHGRRDRMSQNNISKNMSHHLFNVTTREIFSEWKKHLNDPRLF